MQEDSEIPDFLFFTAPWAAGCTVTGYFGPVVCYVLEKDFLKALELLLSQLQIEAKKHFEDANAIIGLEIEADASDRRWLARGTVARLELSAEFRYRFRCQGHDP